MHHGERNGGYSGSMGEVWASKSEVEEGTEKNLSVGYRRAKKCK